MDSSDDDSLIILLRETSLLGHELHELNELLSATAAPRPALLLPADSLLVPVAGNRTSSAHGSSGLQKTSSVDNIGLDVEKCNSKNENLNPEVETQSNTLHQHLTSAGVSESREDLAKIARKVTFTAESLISNDIENSQDSPDVLKCKGEKEGDTTPPKVGNITEQTAESKLGKKKSYPKLEMHFKK